MTHFGHAAANPLPESQLTRLTGGTVGPKKVRKGVGDQPVLASNPEQQRQLANKQLPRAGPSELLSLHAELSPAEAAQTCACM